MGWSSRAGGGPGRCPVAPPPGLATLRPTEEPDERSPPTQDAVAEATAAGGGSERAPHMAVQAVRSRGRAGGRCGAGEPRPLPACNARLGRVEQFLAHPPGRVRGGSPPRRRLRPPRPPHRRTGRPAPPGIGGQNHGARHRRVTRVSKPLAEEAVRCGSGRPQLEAVATWRLYERYSYSLAPRAGGIILHPWPVTRPLRPGTPSPSSSADGSRRTPPAGAWSRSPSSWSSSWRRRA